MVENEEPAFTLKEFLDNVHEGIIKNFNTQLKKDFFLVIAPYLFTWILYVFCQYVLLPQGKIDPRHEPFGYYKPITMTEIEFIGYIGQMMTFIFAIIMFNKYVWNVQTGISQEGDLRYEFRVIGTYMLPNGLLVKFGKYFSERNIAPFMRGYVSKSVTVLQEDLVGLVLFEEHLMRSEYLLDRHIKLLTKLSDIQVLVKSGISKEVTEHERTD